jgi:hypothetical protein
MTTPTTPWLLMAEGEDFLLRVDDGVLQLGRDLRVRPGRDELVLTSPHVPGAVGWIGPTMRVQGVAVLDELVRLSGVHPHPTPPNA